MVVYHKKLKVLQTILSTKKILSFTLKDKFFHFYGSHDELLIKHGLDFKNIANKFLDEIRKNKKKFPLRKGISNGEISQILKVISYYKKR